MDERWMRIALDEARQALDEGELPVGCAIVKGGKLISFAHNERERTNDPTAHAEILAIRRAAVALQSWRLEGCELYVTLEPCPMCAGAISQARLTRLIYGARDERYGCAGSVYRIPEDPAFNHFCQSDGGVLAEECQALLRQFFAQHRAPEDVRRERRDAARTRKLPFKIAYKINPSSLDTQEANQENIQVNI